MPPTPPVRLRLTYGCLLLTALLLGLGSRRYLGEVPFVRLYVGDVLWALMIFFGIALLWPRWPTRELAGAALLFCVGIECSQLYHAPWIDRLRAMPLGGLVLGFSFGWSDLLCYAVGVGLGALINPIVKRALTGSH